MIVKSSIYLLTERAVNSASSIFTMIVAARLLEVEDFGLYTYNTAVFGILFPIVYFGLNGILVRALLDDRDTSSVLVNAMAVRMMAFAVVAVGFGIATIINEKLSLLLIVALFSGLFQVFECFNQAFHYNHLTAVVRITVGSIFILIKGCVLWIGAASIDGMLTIFAAEFLVYFGIGFWISIKSSIRASDLELRKMRSLAAGGIFLLLSGFAEILNLRVDQLMIAEIVGIGDAGMYAIAARFVEFPTLFGAVIAAAYFPKFYSTSSNLPQLYANLRKFNLAMIFLASVFVLILLSFGEFLIISLFGTQYSESTDIMLLLLPCVYILFLQTVISKWIIAVGIFWYSFFCHFLGAVVNVALNIILIPNFGVHGAVYSSILSYITACWIALLFNRKTREYMVNAYFVLRLG